MKGKLIYCGEEWMLNAKKGKRAFDKDKLIERKDSRIITPFTVIGKVNYKQAKFTQVELVCGRVVMLVGGLMPQRVQRKYRDTLKSFVYLN